jgi:hypothetical protein
MHAADENRGLSRFRGVGDVLAAEGFPVPGEQLVDASDRMIGDAGEDVGEPGLGIDVVKADSDDERFEHCGAMFAGIGPVLVAERYLPTSATWSRCCWVRSRAGIQRRGVLGWIVERVDAEECGFGKSTGAEVGTP